MFYVYVLRSCDDRKQFYHGSTRDLRRRLRSHNTGENKATKGCQWELVYYEAYRSLDAARKREHQLKYHGKTKQALMQRIRASLAGVDGDLSST